MTLIEYDHRDPAIIASPYACYQSLRCEDPWHWSELYKRWVLTRYEDVAWALQQSDKLSSRRGADLYGKSMNPAEAFLSHWLLMSDGSKHAALRSALQASFQPQRMRALREKIVGITHALFDAVQGCGEMDFVRDVAFHLPAIVVTDLLGVARDDRHVLKQWTDAISTFMATMQGGSDIVENAKKSVEAQRGYFAQRVAERRVAPQDDLINILIGYADREPGFTAEALAANAAMFMLAGHETTTSLLGNGLWSLLSDPPQWETLCAHPELIPLAVEEMLRFESPVQWLTRIATADCERGGRVIRQGERVMIVLGAANRDPAIFTDPDRLQLQRSPNRHLAFGFGSHFCLGATLARLEAQVAFEALTQRFPRLRLCEQVHEWRPDTGFRGLTRLRVAWD